jgi:hypothetical protein
MSRDAVHQDELTAGSGGFKRGGFGVKQDPPSRFIIAGRHDVHPAGCAVLELVPWQLVRDPPWRREDKEDGANDEAYQEC